MYVYERMFCRATSRLIKQLSQVCASSQQSFHIHPRFVRTLLERINGLEYLKRTKCTWTHRLTQADSSHDNNKPVLTLYTKDPCPLCDKALEELAPFLSQVTLEKVDITKPGNEMLWKAYRYDIPIFHLNGKFLMKHRANKELLMAALSQLKT